MKLDKQHKREKFGPWARAAVVFQKTSEEAVDWTPAHHYQRAFEARVVWPKLIRLTEVFALDTSSEPHLRGHGEG